jgi:hypothetical protein
LAIEEKRVASENIKQTARQLVMRGCYTAAVSTKITEFFNTPKSFAANHQTPADL